jgi:hypothetical protein
VNVRTAALIALLALAAAEARAAPDCRTAAQEPQACFTVRGRLSVANGAPTFRLRPAGSRRLLGVVGGDGDAASASVLPANLRAAMTPAAPGELTPVTGRFRVCPLAPERAGRMRPVCIAEAGEIAPAPPIR